MWWSARWPMSAADGLPGEHHFYVTFRTDFPSAWSSRTRLLAQYPHEMTIVMQHQFWDLKVDEPAGWFSVGLSFGGVPSTLTVPFSAVTGFADPHVQLGLRFRPQGEQAANDAETAPIAPPRRTPSRPAEPDEPAAGREAAGRQPRRVPQAAAGQGIPGMNAPASPPGPARQLPLMRRCSRSGRRDAVAQARHRRRVHPRPATARPCCGSSPTR